MLGIQYLLDHPNTTSPAQAEPFKLYTNDRNEYDKKVKQQARENNPHLEKKKSDTRSDTTKSEAKSTPSGPAAKF